MGLGGLSAWGFPGSRLVTGMECAGKHLRLRRAETGPGAQRGRGECQTWRLGGNVHLHVHEGLRSVRVGVPDGG